MCVSVCLKEHWNENGYRVLTVFELKATHSPFLAVEPRRPRYEKEIFFFVYNFSRRIRRGNSIQFDNF